MPRPQLRVQLDQPGQQDQLVELGLPVQPDPQDQQVPPVPRPQLRVQLDQPALLAEQVLPVLPVQPVLQELIQQ